MATQLLFAGNLGANSYGQLGIGNKEDKIIPTLSSQPFCKLKQIVGGGAHTMFLTDDGDLYSCGWNKDGQLGLHHNDVITIPTHVSGLLKLTKVACGWNHTLSITEHGYLIGWGCNNYHQLGNEYSSANHDGFYHFLHSAFGSEKVLDVGAGLRHSAVITESGAVYTWGDGKKGQLGLNQVAMADHPTKVMALIGTMVTLGAQFTAVLTSIGEVYCWGDNRHGQCTAAPDCKMISLPYKVNGLPPVSRICSGWSHCIALTVDGNVYVWGRGDYGQMGNGDLKDQFQPLELPGLNGVACGSEHTAVLNGDGIVLTWGWNEHGNCGIGTCTNILIPTAVELPFQASPLIIGTSSGHTSLLIEQQQKDF